MIVLVPINVATWLWGWPDQFLNRIERVGSQVFALGPYYGGEFSTGLDTVEDLMKLPPGFSGGIWTNELETAVHWLKERR
jgi:glycerophosphoryl diester phosphodiesterase